MEVDELGNVTFTPAGGFNMWLELPEGYSSITLYLRAIERGVALARHDKLVVADLPEKIRDYRQTHLVLDGSDPSELVTMAELERRYILHALDSVDGNKTLAARILGLDRKTLYRKLQQYGADDPAQD